MYDRVQIRRVGLEQTSAKNRRPKPLQAHHGTTSLHRAHPCDYNGLWISSSVVVVVVVVVVIDFVLVQTSD